MGFLARMLATLTMFSAISAAAGSDEATIRSLEDTWNQAHLDGDTAALASLWADDLVIVVPKMEPMDKASSLRFWKKVPVTFSKYASELSGVRVYGDTAIANGTVRRTRKFGERPEMQDTWYFTKVYRRREGTWQVVSYHASEAAEQPKS
jgi:uncharacterized protein (TIGR02246 family)